MTCGGLFLLWLMVYSSVSTPVHVSFFFSSFTDEEPGEEEGEEIHDSGNIQFEKSGKLLHRIVMLWLSKKLTSVSTFTYTLYYYLKKMCVSCMDGIIGFCGREIYMSTYKSPPGNACSGGLL